nr:13346_t:CDS:1 [Entrophospora candida]
MSRLIMFFILVLLSINLVLSIPIDDTDDTTIHDETQCQAYNEKVSSLDSIESASLEPTELNAELNRIVQTSDDYFGLHDGTKTFEGPRKYKVLVIPKEKGVYKAYKLIVIPKEKCRHAKIYKLIVIPRIVGKCGAKVYKFIIIPKHAPEKWREYKVFIGRWHC